MELRGWWRKGGRCGGRGRPVSAWDVICVALRQTKHQKELSALLICQFPAVCAAAPPSTPPPSFDVFTFAILAKNTPGSTRSLHSLFVSGWDYNLIVADGHPIIHAGADLPHNLSLLHPSIHSAKITYFTIKIKPVISSFVTRTPTQTNHLLAD